MLVFLGMHYMGDLPKYPKLFYDVALWDKKVVFANYGGYVVYWVNIEQT